MERKLEEIYSEFYLARCQKKLKDWGAPLDGWFCKEIIDVREDDEEAPLATCELCDCSKVRFVHVMDHLLYFEELRVGCICAGVMQGNILAAKERENLMKNRSKRRKNFLKKKWNQKYGGYYRKQFWLVYKHKLLEIKVDSENKHFVSCNQCKPVCSYKGKPIDNFCTAVYAAFDLADPVDEIL